MKIQTQYYQYRYVPTSTSIEPLKTAIKRIGKQYYLVGKILIYTSELPQVEGPARTSVSIAASPLCASIVLSLLLAGTAVSSSAEMIVDGVSSEPSTIQVLIRTSIEFA